MNQDARRLLEQLIYCIGLPWLAEEKRKANDRDPALSCTFFYGAHYDLLWRHTNVS
jgi:hypothetical protein